ncbi:hypothetical protein [Weissella confusa]|uniref:hypothetical protein n=1 Tax=Weissella confusa TaxID=1583 RepID=UPI000705163F|nr:hypothetical protein [Weissella confusa]KRN22584.1 hypothetical protein IV69_GL001896 [Weissella confusa]MBJ7628669.1 hypothetical protein [Weissella confusa]MBJ7685696.1 hypothetical protein [Weissella confusa]MBJ7695973.1 hypothetical protein [Weissella confusa]MBJ7699072.1 hypothetical protein [Weissella confusa]
MGLFRKLKDKLTDNSSSVTDDVEYDEVDEDFEESISVYDAAEIWESNGRDEDYTFGYSVDELLKALDE